MDNKELMDELIIDAYNDLLSEKENNTSTSNEPIDMESFADDTISKLRNKNNKSTEDIDMESFADDVISILRGKKDFDDTDFTDKEPDFTEDDIRKASKVKTESPPVEASWKTVEIKGKNGEVVKLRLNQKANVYRCDPNRIIAPTPNNFITKHKKRLFETKFGASYAYKQMLNTLLDEAINTLINIGKITSSKDITHVAIKNGIIVLHKFEIDPSQMLDPYLGNTIYDILVFKDIFKKFPLMKYLALDSDATDILVSQYGSNPTKIFNDIFLKDAKHLEILELDGKKFKRSNFNANELAKTLGFSQMKSEIEHVAYVKNPKKDRVPVGKARAMDLRMDEMLKNGWGAASQKIDKFRGPIRTIGDMTAAVALVSGNFLLAGVAFGIARLVGRKKAK